MRNSVRPKFLRCEDYFSNNHFEVAAAAGDNTSTNSRFITTRIHNSLVQLLNDCANTPKMVVVILENDIIDYLEGEEKACIEIKYEHYLREIMADMINTCKQFASDLPNYAKKEGWPKFVFIEPTLHMGYSDYHERKTFIEQMSTVSKEFDNVWVMQLKQIWEENNMNLFRSHEQIYTNEGISKLWKAIDRTVMFCNRKMTRHDTQKMLQQITASQQSDEQRDQRRNQPSSTYHSRFYWSKNKNNF